MQFRSGPALDRGLVGPCVPGGSWGRRPPTLDLHWILKTRSFFGSDVALDPVAVGPIPGSGLGPGRPSAR